MTTFAVRMPQPMLQTLREGAAERGLATGGLIRVWLGERLTAGDPDRDQVVLQVLRRMGPELDILVKLASGVDIVVPDVPMAALDSQP